jgi:hypothetical protein
VEEEEDVKQQRENKRGNEKERKKPRGREMNPDQKIKLDGSDCNTWKYEE